MSGMMDRTQVTSIMNAILHHVALSITLPGSTETLVLRLMKTTGSEASAGTELTGSTTDPGYTNPSTVAVTFGASSSGVSTSSNSPSWTATGTWTDAINGLEVYDTAGSPLRWLWGALTTGISASTVLDGDTVTFASGAITADASAW